MKKYQINTPLRVAHFLAQIGHESGSLKYAKELGGKNYFKKYDGRKDLGNTQPGDGARFKGRGLIQLTGRSNYKSYGESIGIDLTKKPQEVEKPTLATDVAGWFWSKNKLNALADKDEVKAITKKINGGYNGLEDRKNRLERAKKTKLCEN
jgi:putative chitinase